MRVPGSEWTEMVGDKAHPEASSPVKSRKKLIIMISASLLLLGLSLGFGLGFGLPHGGSSDEDDSGTADGNTTLWQPEVGSKWQIVLLEPIKLESDDEEPAPDDVDIWDIDMFTNSEETIKALKDMGKKVICYFSAGSYEDYRPDSSKFKLEDMGKELDGWPGEKWLDLSSENVRSIMTDRIQIAKDKGCDAIDPDNVDGFQNDNGLDLTSEGSAEFMRFIAGEAAKLGLSTGLKNAGDIIEDVLDVVQFSVNEQCAQYKECETFAQFTKAGKPVFQIEYPDGAPEVKAQDVNKICSRKGESEGSENFSTVIKAMNLDGWVQYCDRTTATTDIGKD